MFIRENNIVKEKTIMTVTVVESKRRVMVNGLLTLKRFL